MSASRKTENFNLPLYNADDATSWLVDFNGAMTELETHLTEMRNNLTTDGEDLVNLEKAVANLNKTTSQLTDSVIKVQESGKSNSSAITLLQTHDNEQDSRLTVLETDSASATNRLDIISEKVETVTEKETILENGLKLVTRDGSITRASIKQMSDMAVKGNTKDESLKIYENSILRNGIISLTVGGIGRTATPYYSITTGGEFAEGLLKDSVIGVVEIQKNNKNLAVISNVYMTSAGYITAEFKTDSALSGDELITIRLQGLKSEV